MRDQRVHVERQKNDTEREETALYHPSKKTSLYATCQICRVTIIALIAIEQSACSTIDYGDICLTIVCSLS